MKMDEKKYKNYMTVYIQNKDLDVVEETRRRGFNLSKLVVKLLREHMSSMPPE